MASAEKASECSVCFEIFVNPKLLPCCHSYCEKCIHGLAKGSSNLQCPTYKRCCDIDQVVHDFQTENFVQAFQELENEFNRRLVEATAASHAGPSTPPENVVTAPMKCELCNDNEIAFWCVECEQWICFPCKKIHLKARYAKDHHIEQLSIKNKEIETSLQTKTQELKVKLNEYHTSIRTLQTEKRNSQDTQLKTLKQSKELRDQFILEINNTFNQIDQDILKVIKKFISRIEQDISRHLKIVHKLEKNHQAILATIEKKDPQLAIEGANIVEQANKLIRETTTPEDYITGISLKLHRLREWSAQAVNLEIRGGRITHKIRGTCNAKEQETSYSDSGFVSSKPWNRLQSVKVYNTPKCIRYLGNQLYICHRDGIKVYDINLNEVKRIPKCTMGGMWDVCSFSSGDLVVAAQSGLYQIKENGGQVKRIADGCFTGVVCQQNRYYAANATTATVHVYEHTDEWKQCHSFSVNAEKSTIITLGITNDLLYVCLANENRIDIFSLDGKLKSSTGCKGNRAAGEFDCPKICCTDAAGAALIADERNSHLHVLNANGQWSIVVLHRNSLYVVRPYSACFVNDTLYVVEWGEDLLQAYKLV